MNMYANKKFQRTKLLNQTNVVIFKQFLCISIYLTHFDVAWKYKYNDTFIEEKSLTAISISHVDIALWYTCGYACIN